MNFIYKFERTTSKELPIMAGQYAVKFVEDEKGKPIKELMADFLSPNKKELSEIDDVNKVLGKQFIILFEVSNAPITEDIVDIEDALRDLDRKSIEYRVSNATTEKDKIKESQSRTYAALHVKGPILCGALLNVFDSVNYDVSGSNEAEIEKNIVNFIEATQQMNPVTFVIPTDLANDLDSKETSLRKTIKNQIRHFKNVFADNSTNKLVRGF